MKWLRQLFSPRESATSSATLPQSRLFHITDVFKPTLIPDVTYVERDNDDITRIKMLLEQGGTIVAIHGASKTGKTTLVRKMFPIDSIFAVDVTGIVDEASFWEAAASSAQLGFAAKTVTKETRGRRGMETAVGVSAANVRVGHEKEDAEIEQTSVRGKGAKALVIDHIRERNLILLLDDFHFVHDEAVRAQIARSLKNALFEGLKVCVVSIPADIFDLTNSVPDLKERYRPFSVGDWTIEELAQIPKAGFRQLNVSATEGAIAAIAENAFGSPALAQRISFDVCLEKGIQKQLADQSLASTIAATDVKKALKRIAKDYADGTYRELAEGLQTRGKDRKQRTLKGKNRARIENVDIYEHVLLGVALGLPSKSMVASDIEDRCRAMLYDANETIRLSDVTQTLIKMNGIARNSAPQRDAQIILYNEAQKLLTLQDPYWLLFLRWHFLPQYDVAGSK